MSGLYFLRQKRRDIPSFYYEQIDPSSGGSEMKIIRPAQNCFWSTLGHDKEGIWRIFSISIHTIAVAANRNLLLIIIIKHIHFPIVSRAFRPTPCRNMYKLRVQDSWGHSNKQAQSRYLVLKSHGGGLMQIEGALRFTPLLYIENVLAKSTIFDPIWAHPEGLHL